MRARPVTGLPARNLVDVRLAGLFDEPGCPVCAARAQAIDRYLASWLWESVNDVAVRRELDDTRGLCPSHVGALVGADRQHSGSMLGSAILLDAMLRVRLRELERARGSSRSRSRDRALADAERAPDCLVCRHASDAETGAIEGIVRQVRDPAWADAASVAAFCLPHLVRLMRAGRDAADWRAVEERQLDRVAELRERLRGFLAHSSHDTRHLRTPEEVAAGDQVAALLGAAVDRSPSRQAGRRQAGRRPAGSGATGREDRAR
jgi:hypothetical protein